MSDPSAPPPAHDRLRRIDGFGDLAPAHGCHPRHDLLQGSRKPLRAGQPGAGAFARIWPGPEDAIGKTDADFCEPAARPAAFLAAEQEIIRTGQPLLGKVERILSRDGTAAWGSTSKLPWRDATGRIIGTFGLTRIITASKIAEEKLIDERNLLRTIIDHLPSRVFVKDKAGRYLINNRAHQKFLGVTKQEDVIGRTVLDFFPGELGQQASIDDQQVLEGGPPILNREEPDYGPEGLIRCVLTTKVPLRDLRGNITGLLGISHDITSTQAHRTGTAAPHGRDGSRPAHGATDSGVVFPAGLPGVSPRRAARRRAPSASPIATCRPPRSAAISSTSSSSPTPAAPCWCAT
jgi:PAS domain S-box-containing protein